MKKKLLLAAVSGLSVLTLAACSSGDSEKIATMKGSTITVSDFYEEAKLEATNQSLVRNMIIYDVFTEKYGDEVTDKMVDKEYDRQKEALGDSFETSLASAGYTTKSFKTYLKQNLALEAGLKDHIKLTDDDYKTAWESFHPEVTAQVIKLDDEETAKDVQEKAKDGDDFTKLAKENSTDTATAEDGGKITFDSQSTALPTEVKTAAFELENDEVSDVITATDVTTYQTSYYVVKMVESSEKGNSMDPYKKELKEIATNTKLSDATFTAQVIGEELADANVKIEDDAFADILADFAAATEETESSEAESTEATESTEAEESTDDSEESTDDSKAESSEASSTEESE
ncbi:MAG: peptidylprolyl isomerase [Enterococcus sp.]